MKCSSLIACAAQGRCRLSWRRGAVGTEVCCNGSGYPRRLVTEVEQGRHVLSELVGHPGKQTVPERPLVQHDGNAIQLSSLHRAYGLRQPLDGVQAAGK